MAISFRNIIKGILLKGQTSDPSDNLEGSIFHNSTENRIKSYIQGSLRELVTNTQAQSIQNKGLDNTNSATLLDTNFTLQDNSDNTKQANLDLSGLTTATTRTIGLPDGDTTLLGDNTAQSVQNKTIDGTAATGTNSITADASNITFVPGATGLAATDVQAALVEVDGNVDTVASGKLEGPGTHGDDLLVKTAGVDTNVTEVTGISIDGSDRMTVPGGIISTLDVDINDATSSTTSGTGALVVVGGVGIGENLNVGGNAIITGDLTVNGTTTTINTDTLDVEDANITINKNGNQASANNTAGITVEMSDATNASIIYDSSTDSKFRMGEVGSEIEVVVRTGDQKIENKRLADNNTIRNDADNSKVVAFNLSPAVSSTSTTVEFNQTANRNVIFPDADTTLIGNDTSDDLSNKRYIDPLTLDELASVPTNPGSGDIKFYYRDGKLRQLDENGVETKVGSGAGGGTDSNYYEDFQAEDPSFGATYNDGGSDPVDGTGGAVTGLTLSNAGTPIEGSSYSLSKDAANRQGQGFSFETTAPFGEGIKDNRVTIQFDYYTDATFATGDVTLWIYRIGSNTLEQLRYTDFNGSYNNQLTASLTTRRVVSSTTISDTDTGIRLILHTASTGTNSYDITMDRLFIGEKSFSPVNSRSGTYTPTLSSATNVSSSTALECRYTQVDDVVTVSGAISITPVSTSSNTQFNLSLPIAPENFTLASDLTGDGEFRNAAASSIAVRADTASNVATLQFTSDSSGGAGNVYFSFSYRAAEAYGNLLDSTQQLLQTASGRFFRTSSSQSIPTATETKVQFNSSAFNNNLDFSSGVGDITVPSAGRYLVSANLQYSAFSSSATLQAIVTVNGVNTSIGSTITDTVSANWNVDVTTILDLEAGDVIAIEAFHNSGSARNIINGSANSYVAVSKLPDLEAIGNAGVPYEYIRIDLPNSSTSSSFGDDNWGSPFSSSFDLDLTPGTWEIGYETQLFITKTAAGAGTTYYGNVGILNDTDSIRIEDSIGFLGHTFLSGGSTEIHGFPVSRKIVETITEDKTYKLQIRHSVSNSSTQLINGGFTGAVSDPDSGGYWYARRLR